jgi:parvulin-like peptidyl-prolyl isomerase
VNISDYSLDILRNEPATILAVIILASILFLIFLIPTAIKYSKKLKKTKFQPINWRANKPVFAVAGLVLILTILSTIFSVWTNWDYVAGRFGRGPEIAAKVEGETILKEDYETRLAAQKYFYTSVAKLVQEEPESIESATIEEMIQEILLTNLLAEQDIKVTDSEVRQRIKKTVVNRKFKGNWTAYKKHLKKEYHTTLEEVMRTTRIELLKEKVGQLKTTKHIFAAWVAKNEPQMISYEAMTDKMEAAHKKANKAKKDKAEGFLQKVKSGEDFAGLAKQVSEDTKSAKKGGGLGFLFLPHSASETPQESLNSFPGSTAILTALENLGAGEIKLYEGFTGYTVVKVTEVKEGPVGTQSAEDWYKTFREKADVTIYLKL